MKSIRILLVIVMAIVGTLAYASDKRFTLVIDAGHGGHDSGAKGARSYEKNINLKVALAFGKYVERNCPDVKVVYTRKTDVFVALYERAEIANRNKANLFVSVHTNALPKGRISRGFETYTLGDGRSHGKKTNLDVAKRENSVIFMEKDYKQHYVGYDPNSPESNIMFEFVQDHNMLQSVEFAKMLQRNVCSAAERVNKGVHQDNFAVLRLTSMPACLVELGFITTPDEEAALNNPTIVDKIARGLYNAFAEYKNRQSGGAVVPYKPEAERLPVETAPAADASVQGSADKGVLIETAPQPDVAAQGVSKSDVSASGATAKVSAGSVAKNETSHKRNLLSQTAKTAAVVDADGIIMFDENAGQPKLQSQNVSVPQKTEKRMETEAEVKALVKEYAPAEPRTSQSADARTASSTGAKVAQQGDTRAAKTSEGAVVKTSEGVAKTSEDAAKTSKRVAAKSESSDVPVFKIQIMVCNQKLKEGDARLNGLKGCDFYQEGGNWKCTYGASTDYNEIYRLRKEVVEKFPTCFIVAFKNGAKTDVVQALKEFKQNRRK